MFIIVEGIDGAGKSKLIDTLVAYYPNYKRADIRAQWEKVDRKNYESRKKFFVDYFQQNKNEKLIVDRFHISEIVYDFTLRDKHTPIEPFETQIFGANINNVVLITIDVHEAVAQARIKERDGKTEEQDLKNERELFFKMESKSTIPHKLYIYNDKFELLEENVKEYIERVCGISGKILEG